MQWNGLLQIWSAAGVSHGGEPNIALPSQDIHGLAIKQRAIDHDSYPSNQIYVRQSYKRVFSVLFDYTRTRRSHDGAYAPWRDTSGIGKFFSFYFIWRMLHPDGIEVAQTPHRILCHIGQWGYVPPSQALCCWEYSGVLFTMHTTSWTEKTGGSSTVKMAKQKCTILTTLFIFKVGCPLVGVVVWQKRLITIV